MMNHKLDMLEKISVVILGIFLLIAFVSLFWTPYSPYTIDMGSVLESPSSTHLLGTDALGRDLLSRLMAGSTITIGFAILAAFCTMFVGIFMGILSGYVGGKTDLFIQAIVNIFQGVPGFSLMIALAGILEPGFTSVLIAIVLTSWTGFSRVIRGEVIKIKSETYMEGIRALGANSSYIISKYVFRSLMPTILVLFTIRIGYTILAVSGLSYIGLGMQPPIADWGAMISNGQTYFRTYPLLLYAPGACILLLCLSINLLGERMKERFL